MEDVHSALELLAQRLAERNTQVNIHVVGSAAIMYLSAREALTQDVDAIHSHVDAVRSEVEQIALQRGWQNDWFNNGVLMFVSHYDTSEDWELRISDRGVEIYSAKQHLLLAMKLLAGRGQRDSADIDALLKLCNVMSEQEAVEIFNHYYPTEIMAKAARQQLEIRFAN